MVWVAAIPVANIIRFIMTLSVRKHWSGNQSNDVYPGGHG